MDILLENKKGKSSLMSNHKKMSESLLKELSIDGIKNGIQNNPGKNDLNIMFINVVNLYHNYKISLDNLEYINLEENVLNRFRVEPFDIFFTRSSLRVEGIAHCNILLDGAENIVFDDHIMRIRPNKKVVNPFYLKLYCLTPHARKFFMRKSKTGTMTTIGQEDIGTLPVKLPELRIQNKIADFFLSFEKKIVKQQEKITMLEQFKKGMMQKIYSQELRFKDEDGGEFPEWEEKKLGQVLKIKHGKDQKKIETFDGKFPILATGGTIGRTDTFIYDKESVLIGRKGTIDRPVYMNKPFWTVDTLFYSEIKESNYPKFVYYVFQNINWKLYNEASGVPSLSAKTIEAIKITAPTFEEQKVIADYLSVLDRKIEKENKKLMILEEQKRGVMQGMFA